MDCQKIGNLILKIRKEKQMTQKEIADKLNISDKTISKWERGLGCPDISLLIPLSEILEISLYELLGGEKISKESQEKVDKVIKDTIQASAKRRMKDKIIDGVINTILLVTLLSALVFLFILFFGQDMYQRFSYKPDSIKISDFVEYKEFLDENNCKLSLEEYECGTNGNINYNVIYGLVSKLPMLEVKQNKGIYRINQTDNQISYNYYKLSEKDLNKHRLDKNYSKKSMIVNSLILFNFVDDLKIISFEFDDFTYLIDKDNIANLYSNKYVNIEKLKEGDNFKKYVIDNLKNNDFIDTFFEKVEISDTPKFGQY